MIKKTLLIMIAILFSIGTIFATGYNQDFKNDCKPKLDKNGNINWDSYKQTKIKKFKSKIKSKLKTWKNNRNNRNNR